MLMYSLMRKSKICDKFSIDTKRKTFSLIDQSLMEAVEYSAAITPDLSLKSITKGELLSADYPKVEDAVGTFHTHVLPEPPSSRDFLCAMTRKEDVVCVGAKDLLGRFVGCFELDRNNPKYRKLGVAAKQVNDEGANFEEGVIKKYGKIPERETGFDDEDYEVYRDIMDRTDDLEDEFKKIRNELVIASCEIRFR